MCRFEGLQTVESRRPERGSLGIVDEADRLEVLLKQYASCVPPAGYGTFTYLMPLYLMPFALANFFAFSFV